MNISSMPERIAEFIGGADVRDMSGCSGAKTYFIDRDGGYFLKIAPAGALKREAEMTRYFHERGLSADVKDYVSAASDYLLTPKITGETAISRSCLDNPERLCEALAECMRRLHSSDITGCPLSEAMNLKPDIAGFNPDYSACVGVTDASEAASVLKRGIRLRHDTLIHGDFCLPNILFDGFRFTGFIDLGAAGAGDRHYDLFWAVWSLGFNLGTNAYRDYFLGCYGDYDPELLRLCGVIAAAT